MPDFTVENHGSLFTFRPNTAAASAWCEDHIPEDANWWAGAVAVEPRFIEAIVDGASADGLVVE